MSERSEVRAARGVFLAKLWNRGKPRPVPLEEARLGSPLLAAHKPGDAFEAIYDACAAGYVSVAPRQDGDGDSCADCRHEGDPTCRCSCHERLFVTLTARGRNFCHLASYVVGPLPAPPASPPAEPTSSTAASAAAPSPSASPAGGRLPGFAEDGDALMADGSDPYGLPDAGGES